MRVTFARNREPIKEITVQTVPRRVASRHHKIPSSSRDNIVFKAVLRYQPQRGDPTWKLRGTRVVPGICNMSALSIFNTIISTKEASKFGFANEVVQYGTRTPPFCNPTDLA